MWKGTSAASAQCKDFWLLCDQEAEPHHALVFDGCGGSGSSSSSSSSRAALSGITRLLLMAAARQDSPENSVHGGNGSTHQLAANEKKQKSASTGINE
jgi:hypothetical protein